MTKTKQDLMYEAEWDAQSLIKAEEIRLNRPRYNRALKGIEKIKKEKASALKAAEAASKKLVPIKKTTKRTRKKMTR